MTRSIGDSVNRSIASSPLTACSKLSSPIGVSEAMIILRMVAESSTTRTFFMRPFDQIERDGSYPGERAWDSGRPRSRPRQREHEYRADSELARRGEISPHPAGKVAADREPETDAFLRARELRVDLHERFEDDRQLFVRDAAAGIHHRHADEGVVRL